MIRCVLSMYCLLAAALPVAAADLFSPVTDVRAAAAGEFHSCVALQDGTVECFGLNEHGQLGDGSTAHRVTAGPVTGLDDATQVVAGAAHSCALREGGTVVCWGLNDAGQLGNGNTTQALAPVAVTGLTDVAALSAGMHHTCAVTQAGTAWCWGANEAGQLGDGTTDPRSIPTLVTAPLPDVAQIDAGHRHTCATTESGAVFCWGDNAEGQLGTGGKAPSLTPIALAALPEGVQEVAAGGAHTCALNDDGTVACWGRTWSPETGGEQTPPNLTPVTVAGLQGVTAITVGRMRTCALHSDASAECWGVAEFGPSFPLVGIVAIDATHDHTCAVLDDGQAHCWGGDQRFGELGTGYSRTRLDAVAVREHTQRVEAGTTFACALDNSGFVRCWGTADDNEIFGEGISWIGEPRLIPELAGVTALSASDFHVCTLKGPAATCWGGGGAGEIGVPGEWGAIPKPMDPIPNIEPIASIDAGAFHTCSVTEAGAAVCWGQAPLGDGTLSSTHQPVTVTGLASGVRQVAGGIGHRCALLDDGTVKCWGHLYSQPLNAPNPTIGDGSGASQLTPVSVPDLQGVAAIAAGRVHTCAVLDTGRVRCWGFNWAGQLGDGTTTSRFTPVEISGLENVVSVHPGIAHTCAVLGDGSAACWGRGTTGQLGNGKRESSLVPVTVTVWDEPIADFGIGEYFTCAVSTSGSMSCWGSNSYNQLGVRGMLGSYWRTVQRSLAAYHIFDTGFESD